MYNQFIDQILSKMTFRLKIGLGLGEVMSVDPTLLFVYIQSSSVVYFN